MPRSSHMASRPLPPGGCPPIVTSPPAEAITPDRGPVVVDFDALMLAPVGDDLAKLLVTTAMTYGHLLGVELQLAS